MCVGILSITVENDKIVGVDDSKYETQIERRIVVSWRIDHLESIESTLWLRQDQIRDRQHKEWIYHFYYPS